MEKLKTMNRSSWLIIAVAFGVALAVTALLVHWSDPLPGLTRIVGVLSGAAVTAVGLKRPLLPTFVFCVICYVVLWWWTLFLVMAFYGGP